VQRPCPSAAHGDVLAVPSVRGFGGSRGAAKGVPPVDAAFFGELMDDDNVFFEEPVADIVERMASLSHGRDE
tara:strand:- start:121 stop:336 length:216 start_codon:yes stop_codon:yes gene_type:complete